MVLLLCITGVDPEDGRGMMGDPGAKGSQGQMGPRGPKGENGTIGDIGPTGQKGEKGMYAHSDSVCVSLPMSSLIFNLSLSFFPVCVSLSVSAPLSYSAYISSVPPPHFNFTLTTADSYIMLFQE